MKKTIAYVLILLFTGVFSYAGSTLFFRGTSGGCSGNFGSANTTDSYNASANVIFAVRVQADCTGDVVSLGFYLTGTSDTSDVALAIYSDSSGSPGTFLQTTARLSDASTISGWNTVALTSSQAVTSGTWYWVMLWIDDDGDGQRIIRDDGLGGWAGAYLNSPGDINTSSWPSGASYTTNTREYGFRATY